MVSAVHTERSANDTFVTPDRIALCHVYDGRPSQKVVLFLMPVIDRIAVAGDVGSPHARRVNIIRSDTAMFTYRWHYNVFGSYAVMAYVGISGCQASFGWSGPSDTRTSYRPTPSASFRSSSGSRPAHLLVRAFGSYTFTVYVGRIMPIGSHGRGGRSRPRTRGTCCRDCGIVEVTSSSIIMSGHHAERA